ncbi:MAG: rhodanese-like domain-containing protein [Candidatus Pacebacteria bacterium]|nr:rhodanese-like domain-containing protein [Candidatus Paceibacterota bacterium]
MNKNIIKLSLFLFCGFFLIHPQSAHAVIPPDFIFNIGVQIVQFFSIILLTFTAILGAFSQFFKTKYYAIKNRKIVLIVTIFSVVTFSFGLSYYYSIQKQKAEYQIWLEESEQYNIMQDYLLDSDNDGLTDMEEINSYGTDPENPDTDGDSFKDGDEVQNGYNPNGAGKIGEEFGNEDENNQLNIGGENNQNIDTSQNKFVSNVEIKDDSAKFISEYYENIAKGSLESAYEMSKKSVDYNTFQNWYLSTTKITLDKLIRIDAKISSIEFTIYEGNYFIRYGVLMTLDLQNEIPVKVEKSEVKILAQGEVEGEKVSMNEDKILEEYDFFNKNSNINITITSKEFQAVVDSDFGDYIVLDAREDIEYENGYFPESWHIRFADLKAGKWLELPVDKVVYVICWSGIRGKEVAEFLRTKKIVAIYLEEGANGWVEFGGKWVGNIKFAEKYNNSRYKIVFDTDDVKKKVQEGVILVDTREPYKFKQSHIAGSLNIPIMYTAMINLENVFKQVPENSKVITVCDGYVNCFDAKITGVELERRGHQFLGRYNKPWEYAK